MDQITTKLEPQIKVSVNIITYNRANFIAQTIESVLAQSFTHWEIIIVDDGSTDQTEEIVKKYLTDARIRYFKNERNLGICASRNRALQESRGKYVAILDSDDIWNSPDKLKKQIDFLDDHPNYVAVGTGVIVIDQNNQERKRYLNPEQDGQIRVQILAKNPFAHSSILYRRDIARSVNGYHPNLNGIEDYDLWLKLGQKGKLHNLPSYDLNYRQHGSNISNTDRLRLMMENLNLVKKYREFYPGFSYALIRRFVRLELAKLLSRLNG
ncbi:MAG: glycosyltransferase family 2 protein [Candidatus Paceibacterota bacterium]|jgi:glycosyltransferase involved in cell wall biosynthesis